jgi:hypothetical protein
MAHTDLESRFASAMKRGDRDNKTSKSKALHKAKGSSKPNIVRVPKHAVDKTEETKKLMKGSSYFK